MSRRHPRPEGAPLPGSAEWPAYLRRLVMRAFSGFQMKTEDEE